jgi:hypothetical protein
MASNPEKSSRASIKIDGQRVPLSPEGIERVRSERAIEKARRERYGGGRADDTATGSEAPATAGS